MTIALLLIAGLLVAFANGANDNFKGVATLLGSGTAGSDWASRRNGWCAGTHHVAVGTHGQSRCRGILMFQYLMIAVALLLAFAFAYHTQVGALQFPNATQRREMLSQMMEQNRRAFPEADEVDVANVIELMKQENVVTVDVRTAAERKVSIIPGALTAAEFERTIGNHAGKTIICYCTIGYRSAKYAQTMKQRGVPISSFNGSIIAWCQAGQKLTTQEGHDTKQVHIYGPKWNLLPPEYQAVR